MNQSRVHTALITLIAIMTAIVTILSGIIVHQQRNLSSSMSTKTTMEDQSDVAQQTQLRSNVRVRALDRTNDTNSAIVTLKVMNVVTMNDLGWLQGHSREDIMTFSRDLIDRQNEIFIKSKINLRVELSDTVLDDSYPTMSQIDGHTINDTWLHDDTLFTTAKKARVMNNADIVMILKSGMKSACGVANGIDDHFHAHDAIASVDVDCQKSMSNLTYAHELGHTLGLNHDRKTAGAAATSTATNFGHVETSNNVRDIMSYDEACVKNTTTVCTQIDMYSSPKNLVEMGVFNEKTGEMLRSYNVRLGDAHDDAVGFINSHLKYYAAMNFNAGN